MTFTFDCFRVHSDNKQYFTLIEQFLFQLLPVCLVDNVTIVCSTMMSPTMEKLLQQLVDQI